MNPFTRLRHECGNTQAGIARVLGIGLRTWVRWEQDPESIPAGAIKKLAYLWEVSADVLLAEMPPHEDAP